MNDLGVLLLGCAARATLVAAVGLALDAAVRRRGGSAALATLSTLAAVLALALSPWPRWWTWEEAAPQKAAAPAIPRPPIAGLLEPSGLFATGARPVPPAAGAATPTPAAAPPAARAGSPESSGIRGWRWPAWAALAILAGIASGVGRLALGLRAVALLRRAGRAVDDPALRGEVDRLAAALGLARAVEVRETAMLSSPATIGWRRPVLLLPVGWPAWGAAERRAVLAHELAHIRRGDYPAGLWAQACLALHFYHPLAHRLVGRLRLEQELAADAWGARLSGGSRPYLTILATLALRQDDRPVGWAARPFHPGRGILLRRIAMLRDAERLGEDPAAPPRRARALAVACLAAAGLLAAGFRLAGEPSPARAQEAPAPAGAGGFDLSLVPADAALVVAARPADLFGRPGMAPLADAASEMAPLATIGLRAEEIEQVFALWVGTPPVSPRIPPAPPGGGPPPVHSYREPMIPPPSAVVVRSTRPRDWKAVMAKLLPDPEELPVGGRSVYRAPAGGTGSAYAILDDRTLAVGDLAGLLRYLAGSGKPGPHAWDEAWSKVKPGQLAVAADMNWVRARLGPGAGWLETVGIFAPMYQKASAYAVGLDAAKGLVADAAATCPGEDEAREVADTANAALVLGRNAVPSFRAAFAAEPPEIAQPFGMALDLIEPMARKARAVAEGRVVRARAATEGDLGVVVNIFLPAVAKARARARRAQSVNNMKQIGLAMHNYHNVHGKFPPTVVMGPDGKTPHSWRVELLPFLEQQSLYEAYKMNEPWDGPNNRKLLALTPLIYRHPSATGDPSFASYFVVTGPLTMFGDPGGTPLDKILDGTSNTILAVEARLDIPWTKPEDIPAELYKPDGMPGAVPEFRKFQPEGFNALMGDGSVRFIKSAINPIVLRALLTKASGEVISADSY